MPVRFDNFNEAEVALTISGQPYVYLRDGTNKNIYDTTIHLDKSTVKSFGISLILKNNLERMLNIPLEADFFQQGVLLPRPMGWSRTVMIAPRSQETVTIYLNPERFGSLAPCTYTIKVKAQNEEYKRGFTVFGETPPVPRRERLHGGYSPQTL